jgi:hypothetical protein
MSAFAYLKKRCYKLDREPEGVGSMRFWLVRRTAVLRAKLLLLLAVIAIAGCGSDEKLKTESIEGSQAAKVANTDIDCPQMMVRTGASTWQVPSGSPSTALRYQGSLGQMARECAILGASMTIKVGVEGRVLVGPKGAPGNLTVPVRIALVQEGPQPKSIWTKFYNVPVVIPQGQSGSAFTQVEDDLTFALPSDKNISSYVIYVGFDPQGAAASKGKGKAASAAAKPKPKKNPPAPAAQTAPAEQGSFAPPASNGGFAPPPKQQ